MAKERFLMGAVIVETIIFTSESEEGVLGCIEQAGLNGAVRSAEMIRGHACVFRDRSAQDRISRPDLRAKLSAKGLCCVLCPNGAETVVLLLGSMTEQTIRQALGDELLRYVKHRDLEPFSGCRLLLEAVGETITSRDIQERVARAGDLLEAAEEQRDAARPAEKL